MMSVIQCLLQREAIHSQTSWQPTLLPPLLALFPTQSPITAVQMGQVGLSHRALLLGTRQLLRVQLLPLHVLATQSLVGLPLMELHRAMHLVQHIQVQQI